MHGNFAAKENEVKIPRQKEEKPGFQPREPKPRMELSSIAAAALIAPSAY